jgi:uncharacterized membrane protein
VAAPRVRAAILPRMTTSRMEAFSDGVIAILITIMVLELGVPHGSQLSDLAPLAPVLLSYVLSFVFLGIYWNNHHHLLQAARHVDGRILWANLLLLFCLSLVPFGTAWMGENGFASVPVAFYGAVLLGASLSYWGLVRALVAHEGPGSLVAQASGRDRKGIASMLAYVISIPAAFVLPVVSLALFVAVEVLWVVPDKDLERQLEAGHAHAGEVAGKE